MGIRVGRADNNKSNSRATGFTLLELLFTVMVAAIVIGIGSPAFSDFRRNAQLTRDANEFLTVIQRARSEAAKRQRPVSLCVADDPLADTPVCSGAALTAMPASGWLLFEDANGDCARATDEPLLVTREPFERLAISANSARTCISFAANGFLRSDDEDDEEEAVYQLLLCDPDDPPPSSLRSFRLSPSGHARVTRDPDEIAASGLSCPAA